MDSKKDLTNRAKGLNEKTESKVLGSLKYIGLIIAGVLSILIGLTSLVWIRETMGVYPNPLLEFLDTRLFGFLPSVHDLISGVMGW